MMHSWALQSSFRDPSGFVFIRDGVIYRQVNKIYKENYDQLMKSGLYENLVNERLLVSHEEVNNGYAESDAVYKVIKPEQIPFISYPYEWCFSQLKDAALTTIKIQKIALKYGMSLKDSSAYNIQFKDGKCIHIDTLSFEKYQEGHPWVAYRQFCQHFLAPLALMGYKDLRLNQLFRVYTDGIPLDLASSLLPSSTFFKFSALSHIHLHAKTQKYSPKRSDSKLNHSQFLALMDNLESAVKSMKWKPQDTQWGDYYDNNIKYSSVALDHKRHIVSEFLKQVKPKVVWDLGANTGVFSRIASDMGIQTLSLDIDPVAVEKNYLECIRNGETNILPLLIDLTNPSPAIGWENEERMSFLTRGRADTVLALALIHHLAISNNLPLEKIARFFNKICDSLIIEFVPKTDEQVQSLLATREDIFPDYTQEAFECEFNKYFRIKASTEVKDSDRTLYLMNRA